MPLEELMIYLTQEIAQTKDDISALNKSIHAWESFICPYTPNVDFNSVVVFGAVATLLSRTTHLLVVLACTPTTNIASLQLGRLVSLWPTIWICMQKLHGHNMQYRLQGAHTMAHWTNDESEWAAQNIYTSVFYALRGLTSQGPLFKLAKLIKGTEGVMQMMATLWIEEAKDATMRFGFRASQLLCSDWPSREIIIDTEVLEHIVNCVKDGPRGTADLVFCRIKRNLTRTELDVPSLTTDLTLLSSKTGEPVTNFSNPASRILQKDILSQPMVVTIAVDILALLLDAKSRIPHHEDYLSLLNLDLQIIVTLSQKIQAYKVVEQLLGTTFLSLMARVALTCRPETRMQYDIEMRGLSESSNTLLGVMIPQFAVYRSFLSTIQNDLINIQKKYRMLPGLWLNGMRSAIQPIKSIYEEYKRGTPMFLSCSEPKVRTLRLPAVVFTYLIISGHVFRKCNVFDDGLNFKRCAACCFVSYCSTKCQQRHWRGGHRELCHDMCPSASGQLFLLFW